MLPSSEGSGIGQNCQRIPNDKKVGKDSAMEMSREDFTEVGTSVRHAIKNGFKKLGTVECEKYSNRRRTK